MTRFLNQACFRDSLRNPILSIRTILSTPPSNPQIAPSAEGWFLYTTRLLATNPPFEVAPRNAFEGDDHDNEHGDHKRRGDHDGDEHRRE